MTGGESSTSIKIDIGTLETYLKSGHKSTSSICQVKQHISDTVYDPVVVSIGPYHHHRKILQSMKKKKWNYVDYILKLNKKINLQDYIKSLKKVEHIARSYYNNKIIMESNDFVNMLLLDGFFILISIFAIEITHDNQDLGKLSIGKGPNNKLGQPLHYCSIVHDIFLIENQIPFLVLQVLYELFIGEEITAPSLSDKICHYMEQILCHYPISIKETNRPRDFHHLLHLCHIYMRPSQTDDLYFTEMDQDNQTMNYCHSAVEYPIVGIKFKKRELDKNNPHSLLDVTFSKHVLEIPYLTIPENTSSLFKNLIALEQANPKFGNDIIAYIHFMSQLVKDDKDVGLLVSNGIIEHDLQSEEQVVDLFMRLSEGIVFNFTGSFYLKNICHSLETHYESRMKRWNVWFRRATSAIWDRISKYV